MELMRHDMTFPLYVEVDEIFNLACPASPVHYQFDPAQTTKTSVIGAINMLGLAKRLKVKVLQASTAEVYGDPARPPTNGRILGQRQSNWFARPVMMKENGAPRHCSSIIAGSTTRRQRSFVSSIHMVRGCIRTMGASCRTSSPRL